MLNTLKQLKHQHFLKQKTKRRAARIEKLRAAGVSIGDSTTCAPPPRFFQGLGLAPVAGLTVISLSTAQSR